MSRPRPTLSSKRKLILGTVRMVEALANSDLRKPDTFDSTAVTSARSSLDASLISVKKTLAYAKVFFTLMSDASSEERAEVTAVLSKVSGFLRSELAKASTMRTVPRISFRFDESVGRGRDMETLLREVRRADEQLHTGDSEDASEPAD